MLHQDDLKWIAKTSTELNTVLQQIARYADLAQRHKGDHDYIEQLNQQVEIATQSAQALFNRVTARIQENTSGKWVSDTATAKTAVVPSDAVPEIREEASKTAGIPSEITVLNPDGERELILIEFRRSCLPLHGFQAPRLT